MFNINTDIGETKNLADQETEKLQELAIVLGTYLKEVDAQMPILTATGKQVDWPDVLVIDK